MLTDNTQMVQTDDVEANLAVPETIEPSKININQVTLKVSKVAEISEPERHRLFEIFNKFKFIIIECEPLPTPQENLLALKKIFGSVLRHRRSDEHGIVAVENLYNSPANNVSRSATNQMHPMHTDGTADIDTPKVVALQCEINSQNGGLSQIAYGQYVYEYLMKNYPQELQKLFTYPVSVTNLGGKTDIRKIFVEKEGRISMSFKADSVVTIKVPPAIETVFNIIKNYVNAPKNQFIFKLKTHQIQIIDNTSVLHGRTSFPDNEVRKINRLWFDGISEYTHQLQFGFIPKSKSLNP
jgi:alpha-ketoglutarate-dependent taurine dioxygenase